MEDLASAARCDSKRCSAASLRIALVLLFACIPCIYSSAINAQGTAMRIETFTLSPNGQVRVENGRGPTSVEVWDSQTVRVVAEKTGAAGAILNPSELVLMSAQNTVLIQCRPGPAGGSINLTIYVPRQSHLQIVGGAWPIEVSGSLASAVIDSTSGSIQYRLPKGDDARVVLKSTRGVVRSTQTLTDMSRTGSNGLQGRIGSGNTPIILNSRSGNILLLPGADSSAIAGMPDPRGQMASVQPAENQNAGSHTANGSGGSGRRVLIPSNSQYPAQQNDRTDVDEPSPSRANSTPPRHTQQPPNNSQSNNNSIDLFGSGQEEEDTSTVRTGPLSRPRRETNTSGGSGGLRVRIIPSTSSAGARPGGAGSIYDDVENEDAGADPSNTRSRQPSSVSGSRGSQMGNAQSGSGGQTSRSSDEYQAFPPDLRAASPRRDDATGEPADAEPSNARPTVPPVLGRNSQGESSVESPGAAPAKVENSNEEETIKLNASLVSLNVSVTDRSGLAIPNLSKEEFEILENGEKQSVEFFAASTSPFNLVLVLDLSGSIKDKIDVVKSAALKFLEVIGPQDKVAVLTFTHEVRVVSQLTANRDLLRKRIKSIEKPDGGTAFYEAMWFALVDTLRGTQGQRNAIVVMTDGVDSSLDRYNPAPTRVTFNKLAQRLEESDVIVFPIYLDTEYDEVFIRNASTSEAYAMARLQLQRLGELTGGQTFQAQQASDLSGVYKQVAAAIRTVYSVGYYPTNSERDGTYRRVRVGVSRPNAAVRTRKGYYAK